MNIGILCPSEIAYRRFLPALKEINNASFVGVAINSPNERYGEKVPAESEIVRMLECEKEKANRMITEYGGRIFDSYEDIISSSEIDSIYIPLPPALHHKWAKRALEYGKHVLVEKPSTISYDDSLDLVEMAQKQGLALHENYMFVFHNQLKEIDDIIESGEIGDIRLYRISFGFPRRSADDFRYNKELGGGALIDAGGYTIKYASKLLGDTAELKYAVLNYIDDFEVDIYGSAALVNGDGITAQVAFGMDNDYKCELEAWGSSGTLKTGRVLTAPAGFTPVISIKKNIEIEERSLSSDDAFKKSIEYFMRCIDEKAIREDSYKEILRQTKLVEEFSKMTQNDREKN